MVTQRPGIDEIPQHCFFLVLCQPGGQPNLHGVYYSILVAVAQGEGWAPSGKEQPRPPISRLLKKHAIFIGEDSRVYAVLGLHNSLEDLLQGRPLPVMAQAVLLPFKGKIVHDGLLRWYNITFGGGIRRGLNEEYMAAKQNDRIITTLEPELPGTAPPEPKELDPAWQEWMADLVRTTERIKGGSAVQSSALGLLRASAGLAQAALDQPDNLRELWRLEQQVGKALTRLQTTLERAER